MAPSGRPRRSVGPARSRACRDLEHANELKTAIEGLGAVELPVKAAADTGKLFGSVTAADVVAAIKKAGGPNLDKRTVQLPKAHIKSVGTHPIAVRLHPDVDASVSLNVVAELVTTASIRPGGDHDRSAPGRCCAHWRTLRQVRSAAKLTSC